MFRPLSLEERVRTFWSPLLDAPGSSGVTCWFTFLPAAWRQHLYRTAGEWGGEGPASWLSLLIRFRLSGV